MEAVDERLHLQEAGQRLEQVVVLFVGQPALHVQVADQDDRANGCLELRLFRCSAIIVGDA